MKNIGRSQMNGDDNVQEKKEDVDLHPGYVKELEKLEYNLMNNPDYNPTQEDMKLIQTWMKITSGDTQEYSEEEISKMKGLTRMGIHKAIKRNLGSLKKDPALQQQWREMDEDILTRKDMPVKINLEQELDRIDKSLDNPDPDLSDRDYKILGIAKKLSEGQPLSTEEVSFLTGISRMGVDKIVKRAQGKAKNTITKDPVKYAHLQKNRPADYFVDSKIYEDFVKLVGEADKKAHTYEDAANEAGLTGNILHRYLAYMKARWPKFINAGWSYAIEWAERFKAGREYEASDSAGQQILKKIDNPIPPNPKGNFEGDDETPASSPVEMNEQSDDDYAIAGKVADAFQAEAGVGLITDEFVISWSEKNEVDLSDKLDVIVKIANEIMGYDSDDMEVKEAPVDTEGTDEPQGPFEENQIGEAGPAADQPAQERAGFINEEFNKLAGLAEHCGTCGKSEGVMKTLATRKMYQDRDKDRLGSGEPQMRSWFKKSLKNKPAHKPEEKAPSNNVEEAGKKAAVKFSFETFDWKHDIDELVKFCYKMEKKGLNIFQVDFGNDSYNIIATNLEDVKEIAKQANNFGDFKVSPEDISYFDYTDVAENADDLREADRPIEEEFTSDEIAMDKFLRRPDDNVEDWDKCTDCGKPVNSATFKETGGFCADCGNRPVEEEIKEAGPAADQPAQERAGFTSYEAMNEDFKKLAGLNEGSYHDFIAQYGRDIQELIKKAKAEAVRIEKEAEGKPEGTFEKLVSDKMKRVENIYDKPVVELIESMLASGGTFYVDMQEIADVALRINNNYGTEMRQVVNALEDVYGYVGGADDVDTNEAVTCTKCGKGTDQDECPRCGAPATEPGDQIDAAELRTDREEVEEDTQAGRGYTFTREEGVYKIYDWNGNYVAETPDSTKVQDIIGKDIEKKTNDDRRRRGVLDEQIPTQTQPTAQELPKYAANDKVSIAGIPPADPMANINGKAGVVVSVDDASTTIRMEDGRNIQMFKSEYLKKV